MIKNLVITMIISSLFIGGCQVKKNKIQDLQQEDKDINISGTVLNGFREIEIDPAGDPVDLTVYRGDYVKFKIIAANDSSQSFTFVIPDMNVKLELQQDMSEYPYVKMKEPGIYTFSLADYVSTIRVVDLVRANYRELNPEEAWNYINEREPLILDVRTTREFKRGHIKNALLIPLRELQKRVFELEEYKNRPILIYCATGNRSTTAAKILLDRGYKEILNMRHGIVAWARSGYPVISP